MMKNVFIPDPIKDFGSYSGIPNVWFDEVEKEVDLKEWKVLTQFLRKTYGFSQMEVRMSTRYLAVKCGMTEKTVQRAVKGLIEKKYLYRIEVGKGSWEKGNQNEENASLYKLVTGYNREFDDSYIDDKLDDILLVGKVVHGLDYHN